jgi:hypothetical protein
MLRRQKSTRPSEPTEQAEPTEAYLGLRNLALTQALPTITDTDGVVDPGVVGVVVDIPSSGGWATLVALVDSTTSLYTSTGGGTIGGGHHASVAAANRALLGTVSTFHERFHRGDDHALPPPDTVRIHLIDADGPRSTELPVAAFWGEEDHELLPVIAAVQDVMTELRLVSPS